MSSSEDEIMEIVNVPSSSDNDLSILSKTTSNITKPDILKKSDRQINTVTFQKGQEFNSK
jgi:hypothetical protein